MECGARGTGGGSVGLEGLWGGEWDRGTEGGDCWRGTEPG